jgi:glycosyltransferase involved in cell wall biosynthesis
MAPLARDRGAELVLVCRSDNAAEVRATGAEVLEWDVGDRRAIAERVAEAFTPWRSFAAERAFERARADVVLMPQQTAFPKRLRQPYVLVVHDLQHLERPAMLPRFDRSFRPRAFPPALAGATKVITISETVRQLLLARCGVPAEKAFTVRHGAPTIAGRRIVPFQGVGGPFLYYPAATHRHKGHALLLQTFANLLREDGFAHWKLLLSGQRTSEWERIDRLIDELGLRDAVMHLGFMPFEQVLGVYIAADAIVFPSEYEGLGLPVLEAGQVGKRIITSRLPVFEELGVPAARRIDFADVAQLKRALAFPGPALERPLRTWEECATETLDVLIGAAAT